jgi:ribosomal protein S16
MQMDLLKYEKWIAQGAQPTERASKLYHLMKDRSL